MYRIAFTLVLAVTAWIHPTTALASIKEPQLENLTFTNYAAHRENIKSVRAKQRADDGRGLLQPQQKLSKDGYRSMAKQTRTGAKVQTNEASGQRDYGQGEVQDLIKKYAAQYGIQADTPLCIAKLESGFNPNSKNKSSTASGVFQYLNGTWKATDEGKAGHSVFDAEQNVKAAVKYMAIHKNTRPWVVAGRCPALKTIN